MFEDHDDLRELDKFLVPWGKEITIREVTLEGGVKMLRVRIKEGKSRFTDLELDFDAAEKWGSIMAQWAKDTRPAE